jgi:uncharacterized protein (DUF2384 family)
MQEKIAVIQAAATVETLLGVNNNAANTRLGLANAMMSGLPVSALDRLASAVAPDDARFKFRLISKAKLERRKRSATRQLNGDEGNRLARLDDGSRCPCRRGSRRQRCGSGTGEGFPLS